MKPRKTDVSPQDLQREFVLSRAAPHRSSGRNGEFLTYFFDYKEQRLGEIEIDHKTLDRHLIWRQFYPFCKHLSPEEVMEQPHVRRSLVDTVGMDFLRFDFCLKKKVSEGLEGRGLGTLAHTLVVRHLCGMVVNPESYTTSYYSPRVEKRLRELLERAKIEEMLNVPVPLLDVQSKITSAARNLFGFTFEE